MRRLLIILAALAAFAAAAADAQPFAWTADGTKLTLTVARDAYVYADSVKIDGAVVSAPAAEKHYDEIMEKEVGIYGPGDHVWAVDGAKEVSYQGCGSGICYPPKTEKFTPPPTPVTKDEDAFVWSCKDNRLTLTIAPNAYIYADSLKIDGDVIAAPLPELRYNPAQNKDIPIFGPGNHVWLIGSGEITGFMIIRNIKVEYRGHINGSDIDVLGFPTFSSSTCFDTSAMLGLLPEFTVVRTRFGLADAAEMTAFLEKDGGTQESSTGLWAMLLLALLGGLALNLTPCVLPLIPVNLAIIGAGAGKKRSAGLVAGAVYGLGMAAAYGVLGLLAAFAGARFGTLNSSPYFNFSVAAVFLLLALAMSGVFSLDFSRFRGGFKMWNRFRFAGVFIFGALAALLAGACVAPAVVTVLLVAAGGGAAAMLPFVLGLGMALPWPLAGAGLAVLPKPGAWMRYVKWLFALIILFLALWYGYTGYMQLPQASAAGAHYSIDMENLKLEQALAESRKSGLPVFLDVWSTSCKNCLYMDRTTFKAPEVEAALKKYIVVKFQIEDYSAPPAEALLEKLGAPGLPAVAVLEP